MLLVVLTMGFKLQFPSGWDWRLRASDGRADPIRFPFASPWSALYCCVAYGFGCQVLSGDW